MDVELQAKNKIATDIKNLEKYNYSCSQVEKKQYNFETTVKQANQKIKVLVYFGKKGIKTIFQGNAESVLFKEVYEIVTGNYSLEFKTEDLEYTNYIGTDETGKGDYFGPLVVCAMYVNEEAIKELNKIGVKDSKELSDLQINKIALIMKKDFPNYFKIILIAPQKYNELYKSFQNVNKLLNWAHSKVIEELLLTIKTETVITDQFSKTDLKISDNKNFSHISFIQMPKAEKHPGVAAASILARNAMNNWFTKKEHEGLKLPKGASSQVKEAAKILYKKYGIDELNNLVKLHFKTTKQIVNEI
ncbi:MAG: ribonuclease HIII [Flavobacteriaceae bacterium]